MDFLTDIGIAGFLFFLAKGLLWIVLFVLMYFGLIKKDRVQKIKSKFSFRKSSKNS